MKKKEYPYQNTSLKNIKGEQWEDIPGPGGYFLVSNYGRIKRLEYETQYRNGAIYTVPEMIIKPIIVKQFNKFMNDHCYFLTSRISLGGKRYSYMIARLVYYCFVEQFDLKDINVVILTKDCDNFNIRPSNLIKATRQDKQRRTIQRKRFRSPLLELSEKFKMEVRKKIIRAQSKQVTQYSLDGKIIKTYSSMAEAQRVTGVFASSISHVASGRGMSSGGYLWRWGKAKRVDIKSLKTARQARLKKSREKYGMKVTQYDMKGNRIAQYPSLKDAQNTTGINGGTIHLVIKGVYKSAKGYFWKKGYGEKKIDLSVHVWGRASTAISQSKKVNQYTLKEKFIQSFLNAKTAARAVKVSPSCIYQACGGAQKTSAGYKWRFSK